MVQTLIESTGQNFREWEEEQLNQAKVDMMMNPRNSVWNEVLKEGIYSQYLKDYLEKQIKQGEKKSTTPSKPVFSPNEIEKKQDESH